MNTNITLFLSLLIFSILFYSSLSDLCNPDDLKALLNIKQAFNNPYVLASWDPNKNCCHWYCVDCDSNNRIKTLSISYGDLSGPIPVAVGDLPYLERLDLRKLTNLTGPIQRSIVKLKNLKFLRLSWTNLSGSIPDFLGELNNLTFLDLSHNNLSGSIPGSLSKLQNLNALHLDRNKLTGPIPESFGAFNGKVPSLYLSHNQLSGKIPSSLSNMDFNIIDLSRNKLEGDASFLFRINKRTQQLDVSRNLLEFNLSTVKFSMNLTSLDLNHNKIFGSIPTQLTSVDLQSFNVSYNRLCGQIPFGGKLQSFDYSSYFHNKCLCGAPLESCK
ncbi:polygalacturonase inhibitor-like [Mangifera indica]|uniref:polygalacturonase inhibitor-like n=1 Tax=Mangifera indica TaxID=29780 RepID=UPI001CFC33E7|nr:polygalacturonase inhibitor-like [Mangifera indica]